MKKKSCPTWHNVFFISSLPHPPLPLLFFLVSGTGWLSILVWFMWLFAAVETQIHKLLVLRHWLGSFAQECVSVTGGPGLARLYPAAPEPLFNSKNMGRRGKKESSGERGRDRNNCAWFNLHNYKYNCKCLRWLEAMQGHHTVFCFFCCFFFCATVWVMIQPRRAAWRRGATVSKYFYLEL